MISPCNLRDGMDTIAFVESTRYGVWAMLTAWKFGHLAHEFLRSWSRVQQALHLALVSTGPADPTVGRLHLLTALPPADLAADEAVAALLKVDRFTADRAAKVLRTMRELCWDATKPPADLPHPSRAPVSNGTHRSRKRPHAT